MINIVMLAYNFNEDLVQLTKQTIHSFRQSEFGKLIIIDNASTVGTGMLREEADVYVRNKTNLGYPAAVNQGMALSDTDLTAIANNDIRVSSNWVKVTEEVFGENNKVGTVHVRMIPYDQPFNPGGEVWVGNKERWCSSSFFTIKKEAFRGYDASYGAGGYDDYSHHHRMREAGWKQAYTNKAEYQHMDSITYRTMEDQAIRAERDNKNREYFKSKHGEYPDVLFAKEFPDQMLVPWRPFP